MDNILSLLGPTATESEHKLLTTEAGNMEVAQMKEKLKRVIEQKYGQKDYDTKRLLTLQEYEETAFAIMQERGLKLDLNTFNQRMDKVIHEYQQNGQNEEAMEQQKRKVAINTKHSKKTVIHPIISASRSRTGRITVSEPAIQNWKSSVRIAIQPPDEAYDAVYSMDFKSYDPTVLAVLSDDPRLKEDLQADDFYSHLFQEISHTDTQYHEREVMKQLFLTCFINGGDAEYHLKKHDNAVTVSEWQKVQTRYSVAHSYIENINQTGNVTSLNGINYQFKRNDHAKFSKFIQHEAAYIFRNVFAKVLENETELDMMTLLPVHDEIMLAVKKPETVSVIQNLMTDSFQEVTGSALAKVAANQLGGEANE